MSQAIASNSTAALAFQNPEDAALVLTAFKADPHIAAAALYDAQGRVFAAYPQGTAVSRLPSRPGAMGFTFAAARFGFSAGRGALEAARHIVRRIRPRRHVRASRACTL